MALRGKDGKEGLACTCHSGLRHRVLCKNNSAKFAPYIIQLLPKPANKPIVTTPGQQ
ncbi:hypothetical protein AS19_17200 [Alcanivorax sp. NBRC 101098]|nr:hypothetical protein AS19_17200 [Alcanivorax sp. NBRC 101098]